MQHRFAWAFATDPMHSYKIDRPSDFARAYFRLSTPLGQAFDDANCLPN